MMEDLFNTYPRPGENTPNEIADIMSSLSELKDPQKEFRPPVVKDAFDSCLYEEMPSHEYTEFLNSLEKFDFCNGDAVYVVGQRTQID